jgi:TolB-like protein
MRKFFSFIFLLGIMGSIVYAQEPVTLDEALQESAVYFKDRIDPGSKIVVLNFQSDYIDLSNYIIDETIALLVNLGNMTVVDRQNLETIQQEMDFQMSGEVSDESAQSIGRKLGAQIIVSGSIAPLGDLYRLRVRAIEVETATIRGINSQNIKLDGILATLTQNRSYRGPAVSRSGGNYDPGRFALDGKTRFGFSVNAMYGTGWGIGGTVTVFEKFIPNFFVAPSVFISAKYFVNDSDTDERKRFFAGGAGILFKRRLTRNERLLLALGVSLEYLFGSIEKVDRDYYGYDVLYSGNFGLFGMGVQGGLSYRLTPNILLDINGLVKFGFGSAEWKDDVSRCYPENHSYTPVTGGAEIGVSFMF